MLMSEADCEVSDWTIVSVQGATGSFLYARNVIEDRKGRFRPGFWMRSSIIEQIELYENGGGVVRTGNSAYRLIGPGERLEVPLAAAKLIVQGAPPRDAMSLVESGVS